MKKKTKQEIFKCFPLSLTDKFLLTILGLKIIMVITKIIIIDKNYIRPLDVNKLLGNAAKARKELKWKPQINIHALIDEMIIDEMNILSNDQ